MNTTVMPQRIAAVAPDAPDQADIDAAAEAIESAAAAQDDPDHLHQLCEDLARWCATRKLYGAPRGPASLLGQLGKRTRPYRPGGPDAACSQELACLYVAYCAQPADALDRQVFEAYYFQRVSNVKSAAAKIGIGRQHWYTLLRDFRRRIYAGSRELIAFNEAQKAVLPHWTTSTDQPFYG